MGQECPTPTPDTESFRATGEHRLWCTDHADDSDGGWCRGEVITLGADLVAHLTESNAERPFIRIERQVVENGRTCYDEAAMIPLEEADEVASGLRELINAATVAPPAAVRVLEVAFDAAGIELDSSTVRTMGDVTTESARLAWCLKQQRRTA